MPTATAYAPYCSGTSHRASRMLMTKFDPEISPWSAKAKPPLAAQGTTRKNRELETTVPSAARASPLTRFGPEPEFECSGDVMVGFTRDILPKSGNPHG